MQQSQQSLYNFYQEHLKFKELYEKFMHFGHEHKKVQKYEKQTEIINYDWNF